MKRYNYFKLTIASSCKRKSTLWPSDEFAAVESIQEIQSMRVIRFAEVSSWSGHPMVPITRENGIPRPMHKSQLPEAEFELRKQCTKESQPYSRSSSAVNDSSNPSQLVRFGQTDRREWFDDVLVAEMRRHQRNLKKRAPAPAKFENVLPASTQELFPCITPSLSPIRPPIPSVSCDRKGHAECVLPSPSPMKPPQRLLRQDHADHAVSFPLQRTPLRRPMITTESKPRAQLTPRRLKFSKPKRN